MLLLRWSLGAVFLFCVLLGWKFLIFFLGFWGCLSCCMRLILVSFFFYFNFWLFIWRERSLLCPQFSFCFRNEASFSTFWIFLFTLKWLLLRLFCFTVFSISIAEVFPLFYSDCMCAFVKIKLFYYYYYYYIYVSNSYFNWMTFL